MVGEQHQRLESAAEANEMSLQRSHVTRGLPYDNQRGAAPLAMMPSSRKWRACRMRRVDTSGSAACSAAQKITGTQKPKKTVETTIELDVTNLSREGIVTSSSMFISPKNDWTRDLWFDAFTRAFTFREPRWASAFTPILRSQRMPNL